MDTFGYSTKEKVERLILKLINFGQNSMENKLVYRKEF